MNLPEPPKSVRFTAKPTKSKTNLTSGADLGRAVPGSIQVPLYYTPRDLVDHAGLLDRGIYDTDDEPMYRDETDTNRDVMWRKANEPRADSTDVFDSVQAHGVHPSNPISLMHDPHGGTLVVDGHHRLAAAWATKPDDFIPTEHERTRDIEEWMSHSTFDEPPSGLPHEPKKAARHLSRQQFPQKDTLPGLERDKKSW